MDAKSMTLKPRVSEKAYGQSQALNVYVFQVPADANKLTIAKAVEDQFAVSVLSVNITNSKGKVKRTLRKSGRPVMGQRSDVKKAYVTLKKGDNIPIFAAEEEAEKKAEKTQEKVDKAIAKETKKEEKTSHGLLNRLAPKRTSTRGNK